MKTFVACVSTAWFVYILVAVSNEIGKTYSAGQTTLITAISAILMVLLSWVLGYLTALAWMEKL